MEDPLISEDHMFRRWEQWFDDPEIHKIKKRKNGMKLNVTI